MSNVQPLTAGESLAAGAEGEQVEELQRRLQHLGHYQGAVDGRYGNTTEAAVRAYQSASGQTEDGTAGVETWTALDTDAQSAGYDGFGGEAGAEPADGEYAAELEVGTLSEDGQWQWDGTDWVAAEAHAQDSSAASDAAAIEVGTLSDDGHWQWNGADWVAAGTQAQDATAGAAATDATAIEVGTLSEDGYWQWNGTDWVAAGTQPTAETPESAETPAGETPAAETPAAGAPAGETGSGETPEAKPWTSEINSEIDDPTTEAAELPSFTDTESAAGASA